MGSLSIAAAVTVYEGWSLGAMWVNALASTGAVAVAVIFGFLTLANNRRARDAQERAALVAVSTEPMASEGILADRSAVGDAQLVVRGHGGEEWLLINEGPHDVFDVEIAGLTTLDQRRLQGVADTVPALAAAASTTFVLVSRLSLSGPANVVVSYRLDPSGPRVRRVLLVPSP